MKKYILFIITVVLMIACKPQQVIVHDIQYKTNVKHDSVYINQTDTLREFRKGDTVYIERIKTKSQFLNSKMIDTLTVYKEVPVKVQSVKNVPVYVDKKQPWYETLFIYAGMIGILLLVIFITYKVVKNYTSIKKLPAKLLNIRK